jgi:NTE family protein
MSTFLGAPRPRDLVDPGYLLSGAFSLEKLERYLERFLPLNDFRQLHNKVFVTAADVDTGEREIFGPGYREDVAISKAVAASCAVPGLFRPVRIGDRHFVDGEIVRTLSADVAVAAGANVVIISNVYRPEHRRPPERSIARRGALAVLRQSLNVVMSEKEKRGVELLSRQYPKVAFLDIAPDIGAFGYLDRWSSRSLVLRGYRTALRTLTEAKERGLFQDLLTPNASLN